MRTTAFLMMIPLVGCSQVLGIDDPSTGKLIDGGIDAPPTGDHLAFSIGNFKVAQQQMVRFHVQLVHTDGRTDDVTATAKLSSDNDAVATIGGMDSGAATVKTGTTPSVATITASLMGAASATVKATVTAIPCHPVINEVVTGTVAAGQNGGPADEWIEIYNPCTATISVDGWTLDYRSKASTTGGVDTPLLTLVGSMMQGDLRLYGGPNYKGPPAPLASWSGGATGVLALTDGAIGLRNGPADNGTGTPIPGTLMDSIAYGNVTAGNLFIEGKSTQPLSNGLGASRVPYDGRDEGDGSVDFKIGSTLTPGALNAP